MEKEYSTAVKVALISMPWALFSRPSVQLGALKSFLEKRSDADIRVDCLHPYLSAAKDISVDTYTSLSNNSWAGEALYSAVLYPENYDNARKVFVENCRNLPEAADRFHSLTKTLTSHLERWVDSIDFSRYDLIGFSVCFSQLFSSLAAAARIKACFPQSKIVFGGSTCVGEIAQSLVSAYPQIDYIIEGEGEIQLEQLCRTLKSNHNGSIAAERQENIPAPSCESQLTDFNSMEAPDYHPYFSELKGLFPSLPFTPTLPIEFSRGCWWGKCTFCNLNLQWHGYRSKTAVTMIREVKKLKDLHHCLDFTFCDNALPPKESDAFFQAMIDDTADYNFFAEIRAVHDSGRLRRFKKGGLNIVQVGVESLSSSLLKRMRKGTSVIENLAIMKYCSENSITLDGNLITEFPGTTDEEIKETLSVLDFVLPFNPLSAAAFFLGYGSPVDKNPADYSIRRVVQHKNNAYLFPSDILDHLNLLIRDYHGDKSIQKKKWKPVVKKIARWQHFHDQRKNARTGPLTYRDGDTFLIIRQERYQAAPLLHRLQGTSRSLYLYCCTIRSLAEIRQQFPNLGEKTLLNFFYDLSKKQLLFIEDDRFLSLAIHHNNRQ